MADELHPALVLMDINMPEMNGIEATRASSRRTLTSWWSSARPTTSRTCLRTPRRAAPGPTSTRSTLAPTSFGGCGPNAIRADSSPAERPQPGGSDQRHRAVDPGTMSRLGLPAHRAADGAERSDMLM